MKTPIRLLIITSSFALCGGALSATNFVATDTGNWNDGATWDQGAATPGVGDRIEINGGVTVTLDSGAHTIASIYDSGKSSTDHAAFIISGAGTSLTATADSQLFYDSRLDFQVLGGATVNLQNLKMGNGNDIAINVTVTDSFFTAKFDDQMRGSTKDGWGKVLLNGTTIANATGRWGLNPTTANATMLLQVDGKASLTMNNHALRAEASAAGSTAKIMITNGGRITSNGELQIYYNADATNVIQIYGAGSTFSNGNNRITIGNTEGELTGASSGAIFGGYDELGNFVAADSHSMYNDSEIIFNANTSLTFILGDSNFSEDKSGTAIIEGKFFKQVQGAIELDFSNIEALDVGTYYVNLMTSYNQHFWNYSGADPDYDFADHITIIKENANVIYEGVVMSDDRTQMFVQISVIPEAGTYAAIFGALALAFAIYRRRA